MTEHRITTTMQPDRVIEVSDEELQDLQRMNVVASLLGDDPPTQEVADGGQEESEADGGQAPEPEEIRFRPAGKE